MSTEYNEEARAILLAFGDSVGHRHGWRSQAARLIGRHASLVSRLLTLSISVSPDLITRVRGLKAFYGCDASVKTLELVRGQQSELVAMHAIDVALSSLDEGTRKRVLDWTNAKFGGAR